jgi:hypothetical protein
VAVRIIKSIRKWKLQLKLKLKEKKITCNT